MSEISFRVVKEWDVAKVRITDAGQKRADLMLSQGRCLACEEKLQPDEQVKCGQCATCYQAARRAMQKNVISRNELIREGKMLAPAQGGRKPSNKFTKELRERG
jgi:polyferredoxin